MVTSEIIRRIGPPAIPLLADLLRDEWEPVRRALYMAALVGTRHNPIIKDFYQRLLAVGKPKQVALTACICKLLTVLNGMVRSNTVWRTTTAQTA